MKLPSWYIIQLLIWLLMGVPAYAVAALWGGSDWWLLDNMFDGDLAAWEIALFSIIFFHPLVTLPFAVVSITRRRKVAAD